MATSGALDASRAKRVAIASLLRIVKADLADARLVLRKGQARNAAVIGGRAVANLIRALAASEHEWPSASGHDVIDAIPSVNPLQHSLLATEALLTDAADQPIGPDGHLEDAPDDADISDALDDVEAILDTAAQAFGVALSGEKPAANADPIRPPELADNAEEPYEPTDGAAEEADEPIEIGEETAHGSAQLAQDDKAPAPARVVRANRPKRRAAASGQETEPANGEARSPKAVIVHGEPPRPPRQPSRKVSPSIESAVTPPPATDVSGSLWKAKLSDAPTRVTSGQSPREQAVHHAPHDYASTVFWALMDRWKLSDPEALALIGHTGGMTKKGTRPRFKVVGQEAKLFGQIREIDAALSPLVGDAAAWIRQPIKEAPFHGQTAAAYITQHGVDGAREVARLVLMTGLRQQTSV
jgi:hypothetical protein